MDMQIAGLRALVVGASQGIGYAVAHRLAQEGAEVTLVARDAQRLAQARDRIAKETSAVVHAAAADVTRPETLDHAVATAGGSAGQIDILVTNVGGPPVGKALVLGDAQWRNAFDQVVMSTLWVVRAAHPMLAKSSAAAVACINSYAYREPAAERGLSNVPRAGLAALVKTLAAELSPDGIRINNVCPGPIWTDRARQLLQHAAERAGTTVEVERQKLIDQRLLVKRYGAPEDVADAVTFLVSPRAGFITGSTIPVDGGLVRSLS